MQRDINLRYVTITGADDNTEIMDLLDLSSRYPFVEWGILFSQSKAGVARYPSLDWVNELKELHSHFAAKNNPPNFSSHLCGKWVSDLIDQGEVTFFKNNQELFPLFGRVQINCYREKLKEAVNSPNFWKAVLRLDKPIILGGNYANIELDVRKCSQYSIYPLFDSSGGNGKSCTSYHEPFTFVKVDLEKRTHIQNSMFCGYAGGLGPDNISEELDKILDATGTNQFWIDMESRIRTDDHLDLNKVEKVLEIVSKRLSS